MVTLSEEKKREMPSQIAFLIAILSLLPFIGIIFLLPGTAVTILFYTLAKKIPEKYGGIYRFRITLTILVFGVFFQYGSFYYFFKYKIDQANDLKYSITIMRLYSAAEAMENYEKETGCYPVGETAAEIEKELDEKKIVHLPFKDGWGNNFIVRSKMWDYNLTAENIPEKSPFVILRAQKRKPIFPFVGNSEDFGKLIFD